MQSVNVVNVLPRLLGVAAGIAAVSLGSPRADASVFSEYGAPYRVVSLPPTGAQSFGVFGDVLSDGRIVGVTGNSVYVESGVKTGVFSAVATFDASQSGGSSDPTFVRVSPNGSTIAVGLGVGKPVAVFSVSAMGTAGSPSALTSGASAKYYNVPNYQGAWADNTRIAISSAGGSFGSYAGSVSVLDTTSPAAAPSNTMIITGITGASGGVAIDSAGRLYTSNGYANGGSPTATGAIKAFPASVLTAVVPVNFNSGGTLIGKSLSGDGLVFDTSGNLFVGGADFDTGDSGYFGIVSANAIAAAWMGAGPFNPADASQLRKLTPDGTTFGYYGAAYNPITGEAYATTTDFIVGTNTWYATVPTPGASMVLAFGVLAVRRRR